jgi:xanthine dehydrogenase small subunit
VYLGDIPELGEVAIDERNITLGAGVSLARAAAVLRPVLPEFSELMQHFGSAQIRNAATLGGNLASGSSVADTLPVLLAEDAEVALISARGSRRMPVSDFLTGYKSTALVRGEIISCVCLKRPAPGMIRRLYKISRRSHLDIGIVTAAIATQVEEGFIRTARVAFGGASPAVARLRGVEAALEGRAWSRQAFVAAGKVAAGELNPRDDVRGAAEYRSLLAANLFEKYYWDAVHEIRVRV